MIVEVGKWEKKKHTCFHLLSDKCMWNGTLRPFYVSYKFNHFNSLLKYFYTYFVERQTKAERIQIILLVLQSMAELGFVA